MSAELTTFTFTLARDCPRCGAMLPVNGPLRSINCWQCTSSVDIEAPSDHSERDCWTPTLAKATGGEKYANDPFRCDMVGVPGLLCARCFTVISVDTATIGRDTRIPCPRCSREAHSIPAPHWLKAQLPTAVQVLATVREPVGKPGRAEAEGKKLNMACPSCGTSVEVASETERVASCVGCKKEIFVPDDVWWRLHPSEKPENASDPPVFMACTRCSGAIEVTPLSERVIQCEGCGAGAYVPEALWMRFHPRAVALFWTIISDHEVLETSKELNVRAGGRVAYSTACPRCGKRAGAIEGYYGRLWCINCVRFVEG